MSYQKQSKALYSDSEDKVLPSTLRRGIFTIFVDYNVDKNSSSITAGGHFQGEGVTALQLTNEEELLTSFYDDVPEPTSCAGYAEKQSRDKTGNVLTHKCFIAINSLQIKFCRTTIPFYESGSQLYKVFKPWSSYCGGV